MMKLADPGAKPRRQKGRDKGTRKRTRFEGMSPEKLSAILRDVEAGNLEPWADFVDHIIRADSHIASVHRTNLQPIAGARFIVTANGENPEAQQAAADCLEELEQHYDTERLFMGMLHAEGVGWAVAENVWTKRGGVWRNNPHIVEPRDVDFTDRWGLIVRSWDGHTEQWLDVAEEPDRWIFSLPSAFGQTPNLSGYMHAVAWPFVFKRWTQAFWMLGAERGGNGILIGEISENATATARDALFAALESVSADHSAVVENGTSLRWEQPVPNDVWEKLARYWDEQISKAILGSTLAVDGGATGGNRALGETQFTTTILPRWQAQAKRLSGVIERGWFKPFLRLNAAKYGGKIPPTPRLKFQLTDEVEKSDDPPPWYLLIDSGAVTVNEVRQLRGLDPLEDGDRPARANPERIGDGAEFSRARIEGNAEPARPFPRLTAASRKPIQHRLPWTSAPISRTSSTSRTPIENVPFGESDDPER